MAETASTQSYITVDEYFAMADPNGVRHEYVDGVLFAFAGTGWWHNEIVRNIDHYLNTVGRSQGRVAFRNDMNVRITDRIYYLPDVVVTCDPSERGNRFLAHPCFIAEVLSPSTSRIDRGEKMVAYQTLESLQSYLVVYAEQRRVIWYARNAAGWQRTDLIGDGAIHLQCPWTDLTLAQIYRDIDINASATEQ